MRSAPWTNRNCSFFTRACVQTAVPECFRQRSQWQWLARRKGGSTSKRTPPQRQLPRTMAALLLLLALDPRDKSSGGLALVPRDLAQHFSRRVEHHDGRKSFFIDPVLFAQLLILLLQFGGLLFPLRIID